MHSPAPLPAFASRIVPVVVIADVADAVPLARALLEGGVDVIEVTLRSDAALASIAAIARDVPGMTVGAGTVTHAAQVRGVLDAGAAFALSPGFSPALLQAACAHGLAFIPGVCTPSEAMQARDLGFDLLKFFPAAQSGGVATLRAWRGPLPGLRFCPTGGVDEANFRHYLEQPNVAMVGGSWLTPEAAIVGRQWGLITEAANRVCR